MYKIRNVGEIQFLYGDYKKISKKLGLNNCSLSRILNGRAATKYTTAYCIVKLYDSEKEVIDYFDRID